MVITPARRPAGPAPAAAPATAGTAAVAVSVVNTASTGFGSPRTRSLAALGMTAPYFLTRRLAAS